MMADTDRARDALHRIDPACDRETWVKAGMAAHAAGLDFSDFDQWSAGAKSYDQKAARDVWRSFKPDRGISAGTLYHLAGTESPAKPLQSPARPKPLAFDVGRFWGGCEPLQAHPYLTKKKAEGVPLDSLRIVPADERLKVAGREVAGALVVPALNPAGELQSLQFILPDGVKLNAPGCALGGSMFAVGKLEPGGRAYVAEGLGTAWAIWQATGAPAVVSFGCANMGAVARSLRDKGATVVLVPDRGTEAKAEAIAREVGAMVVCLPESLPQNADAWDLAQSEGMDALELLLSTEPATPAPRFKLLRSADLQSLPPHEWKVRKVLPKKGIGGIVGRSTAGKSFLALDLAACIAEGEPWFDYPCDAGPVVYVVQEGQSGFIQRCRAWEKDHKRPLPDGLALMVQGFNLREPKDVADLAAICPKGSTVVIDTLAQSCPGMDENSGKDMGEAVAALQQLQTAIDGLVLAVHHEGKTEGKGMRGHSSLYAAMDAVVAVSAQGEARVWTTDASQGGKAKDADATPVHGFRLHSVALGEDEYGEPIQAAVVRPDHAPKEVARVKLPQGGNQRIALNALRVEFKARGRTGVEGAPPLRLCLELEHAVNTVAASLAVDAKRRNERAREAVTGLIAKGVLDCKEGFVWQT